MLSDNPSKHVLSMAEYERVNLSVALSANPNGLDLPLDDIATLRFFFNLGVQRARTIILSHQQQQANAVQLRQQAADKNCTTSTNWQPNREDSETLWQFSTHAQNATLLPPSGFVTPTASPPCPFVSSSSLSSARQNALAFPSTSSPSTAHNPIFSLSECRFTRAFQLQEATESRDRQSSTARDALEKNNTATVTARQGWKLDDFSRKRAIEQRLSPAKKKHREGI